MYLCYHIKYAFPSFLYSPKILILGKSGYSNIQIFEKFSVDSLEDPEMMRTDNFPLFVFLSVFRENLALLLKILKCCSSAF